MANVMAAGITVNATCRPTARATGRPVERADEDTDDDGGHDAEEQRGHLGGGTRPEEPRRQRHDGADRERHERRGGRRDRRAELAGVDAELLTSVGLERHLGVAHHRLGDAPGFGAGTPRCS